jgi:putative FmdB family regulatory protein
VNVEDGMPLYEFRCDKCGQTFEMQQSLAEHEHTRPQCPKCHSAERVEPRLSQFNAVTSRKS